MRLYQKNFEDNNLAATFGHMFLYAFLFLIPADDLIHPALNINAAILISLISLGKLYLNFFSTGKNWERTAGFTLIEMSAMFWALLYISEIMLSPSLNHYIIILFLWLTGVAYVAAFALYRNPVLNYTFSVTILLIPALFTPIYLEELKVPLVLLLILSFLVHAFYSKMHYKSWLQFLAEKKRADRFAAELVKANQKLKVALNEAEEATRMKGDFIATVSHEIRTPMNGILGMSSLIQETNLDEEQQEFVSMIQSSADTLLTIINDILDFSKLEAGKLGIERVSFNLFKYLNEAGVIFGEAAAAKSLTFELVLPVEFEANVFGDPVRVRQILTNLIGNAIKFTLDGFVRLSVKIILINDDSIMARFKIEDSGIGIESTSLDSIFDRFTQADASTTRKFGGTGLGLAITKELVELMDGKIEIESYPGTGTVFYVNIPFKLDHEKKALDNSAESDEKMRSIKQLMAGKKILLAEDNVINQKVASLMLKKTHCTIEVARDGEEAVDMVANDDYDLVFMDIQMPVLSGVEATAKIRSTQKGSKYLPIIAMTANAMKGDREKYIDAGMDDYISKPFKQENLFNVLSKWLS
jgi:signal transduction histidine kinase/CheY-like chemotaxis protein